MARPPPRGAAPTISAVESVVPGSDGVGGVEVAAVAPPALGEAELMAFVRGRMSGIKACYEAQLTREPALQGRLRVRFDILESGLVSRPSAVENTLGSPDLEGCVINVVRAWHTPFRPAEAVEVEYPFVFFSRSNP
jgi:Gram-negative bacterial TonB protein C-terminal